TTAAKKLFLRLRPWCEPKIEVARLERVLVLAQGRVVRRHRHGETGRQPPVEQAGALELVEAGQIADRLEPEMRQKRLRRTEGERTPRGLATAARADPASLEQHVDRALGDRHAANVFDLGAG